MMNLPLSMDYKKKVEEMSQFLSTDLITDLVAYNITAVLSQQ